MTPLAERPTRTHTGASTLVPKSSLRWMLTALIPALAGICACSHAELAGEIPEGKLLLAGTMAGDLDFGVYGPSQPTAGEPALLTVLVLGNEATRISSGLVLLAAPTGSVQFRHSPPPTVHCIPCRQWSADTASEWKQLLPVGPEVGWAYNIAPMAHILFRAGPGELLDSVLSVPERPSPPAGSPFHAPADYDHIGAAFISDESIIDATPITPSLSAAGTCQGAHGLRAVFPATITDPVTTLHIWVLLNSNGQYAEHSVSLDLTSRTDTAAAGGELTGPPELSSPEDGQLVRDVVEVVGETAPGLLVATWIEIYDPAAPELRTRLSAVRHIADDFGAFRIPVALPAADAGSGETLVYEVHVRTEAPAYRSAETVRKLTLTLTE